MLCSKCGVEFEQSSYQKKARNCICLACKRIYDRAYRKKRIDAGNPLISGRVPYEQRKESQYHYARKDHVKRRVNELQKVYRNDINKRWKHQARWALNKAVKSGVVIRGTCEVCGDNKVDAHHDDYTKPLSVRWMCRKHHAEHHKNNAAEKLQEGR